MEDFYAGGLRAMMAGMADLLDLDARTVTGGKLGDGLDKAEVFDSDVIRGLDNPVYHEGSLAVLRNARRGGHQPPPAPLSARACRPGAGLRQLCRDGPRSTGRIWRSPPTPSWCCATPAPRAVPACPNGAYRSQETLKQGVRDMVRLSDARMSGTSYGACILHGAGSFRRRAAGLVKTGDMVRVRSPRAASTCWSTTANWPPANAWQALTPRHERAMA